MFVTPENWECGLLFLLLHFLRNTCLFRRSTSLLYILLGPCLRRNFCKILTLDEVPLFNLRLAAGPVVVEFLLVVLVVTAVA